MRGSPNRPRATNEQECTCSKFGIGSSRIARSVSPRRSRVRRLPRRRPSRRAEPLGASATPLERSLDIVNHSPSGFEWGYSGSGPAQLACALLLDYYDDEQFARDHYIAFRNQVVSQLECDDAAACWHLTGEKIDAAMATLTDDVVAIDDVLAPRVSRHLVHPVSVPDHARIVHHGHGRGERFRVPLVDDLEAG
nr:DUF6166 domain-containing protein [Halostagnicola kamekurae]